VADTVVGHQAIALDQHVVTHQCRAGKRLQLRELRVQSQHRGVELVDAADGLDLRHLGRYLRVVHRVERILVLQLRHEQLEEPVFGIGCSGRAARGGDRSGGRCGNGVGSHVCARPTASAY
jgi:hypothetical protein